MIPQAKKDRFKELNGMTVEELIAAHNDAAEKDITLPDGKIFTDTQLSDRDGVKIKEGEKLGEKKAVEIAKTEIKKHAGIEVKGERWGDIGTELKAAINATGDDKVKQLQEQNALLLTDKTKLSTDLTEAQNGLKKGMFELDIISRIPAGADMTSKERFELAKMRGYSFEEISEGVVGIKKSGEFLKDTATHAPLPIDKALPQLITEQKWAPAAAAAAAPIGGRGVQQKPVIVSSAGIKTHTQAEQAWKESNPEKDLASAEGQAWYNEVAKAADFDMNS